MPRITKSEARRLVKRAAAPLRPRVPIQRCERDGLRLVIEAPFSMALLKNHSHTLKRHLVVEAREAREALIDRIHSARLPGQRRRWPTRKTWLELEVWKPSHRPDAINLLDSVADAVKQALGTDDRWFSVRRLDWQIDREEPRFQLVIEADGWEDQAVCEDCGAIKDEREMMASRRRCRACHATRPTHEGVKIL